MFLEQVKIIFQLKEMTSDLHLNIKYLWIILYMRSFLTNVAAHQTINCPGKGSQKYDIWLIDVYIGNQLHLIGKVKFLTSG